ncbi:hypothetical protein PoB_006930600 [Plakobranchus ocellatus]|uniref:Uncharacterized protein n=1 Tax=Plakobranchus ocellatus TaxID=259542 RepID=A0AAV4DF45_9GAST|nr:hypothetical protein PoB_006930600 [Plakobranchus ocellatus]
MLMSVHFSKSTQEKFSTEAKIVMSAIVTELADPQQASRPSIRLGPSNGARTGDRRVPAYLRADSVATVPPTPLSIE